MGSLINRAKASTATTGTGAVTPGAAVSPYSSWSSSGAVTGSYYDYLLEDGTAWELGVGYYNGTTLTRPGPGVDTFFQSSTGALLNLSGSATVANVALSSTIAAAGAFSTRVTARHWRVRQVTALIGQQTDGLGFAELKWLSPSGTALTGSGTPYANYTDTGGGWSLAAAFDGSTASGNGWYSGSSSQHSWLAYDFLVPVTPAQVSFCPLYSYPWTIHNSVAIDYSDDSIVWKELCIIKCAAGANNTFQTFTLPFSPQTAASNGVFAAPTLVQSAYFRNTTGGTMNFGTAPVVGNTMVMVWTGPGGSRPIPPSGWTSVYAEYTTSANPAYGNQYQGVRILTRVAQSGDTGISVTVSSDNHNWALFEFDRIDAVFGLSEPLAYSGSNWFFKPKRGAYGTGIHFAFLEHDGSNDFAVTAQNGVTVLNTYTGGGNHRASLMRLDDAFVGSVAGTVTSPSTPIAVSFGFAKYQPTKPLTSLWSPPLASAFSLANDASTDLALTNDPDVGLIVGLNGLNANALRYAYRTLATPASSWDLRVNLTGFLPTDNYGAFGLLCLNSTNNRHNRMSFPNDSSFIVGRYSALQTFSTYVWNSMSTIRNATDIQWLRMYFDGTNINYYISVDGKQWMLLASEAPGTYLTASGGTVNRVGIFMMIARTTGQPPLASCPYFSLTGPGV